MLLATEGTESDRAELLMGETYAAGAVHGRWKLEWGMAHAPPTGGKCPKGTDANEQGGWPATLLWASFPKIWMGDSEARC